LEQEERKRQLKLEKQQKASQAQKKQEAKAVVSKAPRGSTISLFNFGGDKSDAPTVSTPVSTSAPRGVPVISRWKQARDGSITGVISGSSSFRDGDPVTTSPITGKAVGGAVVTTKSGSKYFLDGGNAPPKVNNNAKVAQQAREKAAADARALAAEKAQQAKQLAAEKREAQLQARKDAAEAKKLAAEQKKQAAEQKRLEQEEKKKQKASFIMCMQVFSLKARRLDCFFSLVCLYRLPLHIICTNIY